MSHIRDKAPEVQEISEKDVGNIEELFSPMKDLIPEETCKKSSTKCVANKTCNIVKI